MIAAEAGRASPSFKYWHDSLTGLAIDQTPIIEGDAIASMVIGPRTIAVYLDSTPIVSGGPGPLSDSLTAQDTCAVAGRASQQLSSSWASDLVSMLVGQLAIDSAWTSDERWAPDSTPIVPSRRVLDLLRSTLRGVARPTGLTDGNMCVVPRLKPHLEDWVLTTLPRLARDAGRTSTRATEAEGAVEAIAEWLMMTRDEVAALAGVAPRTVAYWNAGRVPRATTIRRLLEIHTFVRSLVNRIGVDGAREWLAAESVTESTQARLQVLGAADGVQLLLREAASLLFPAQPHRVAVRPEFEDVPADASPPAQPDLFQGSPHRVRRRG